MGWSIGYDDKWDRDIGYGVPAYCDHPKCNAEIDRGLSYVCGGDVYGGEHGCGLFFCSAHRGYYTETRHDHCKRCGTYKPPYAAKPDHPTWMQHKLSDESWAEWRAGSPRLVAAMREQLSTITPVSPAASTPMPPRPDDVILSETAISEVPNAGR